MRNTILRMLCLVAVAMGCASLGSAIPTSINAIPTADTLGYGKVRVVVETSGSGKLFVNNNGHPLLGVQVGVLHFIEAGVDVEKGDTPTFNIRWRSSQTDPAKPLYAIGIQNLAGGTQPQYYVAVSKSFFSDALMFSEAVGPADSTGVNQFIALRVHGGMLVGGEGRLSGFAGVNAQLNHNFVRSDIVVGGGLDRISVGVGRNLGHGVSLALTGYLIKHEPDALTLELSLNPRS